LAADSKAAMVASLQRIVRGAADTLLSIFCVSAAGNRHPAWCHRSAIAAAIGAGRRHQLERIRPDQGVGVFRAPPPSRSGQGRRCVAGDLEAPANSNCFSRWRRQSSCHGQRGYRRPTSLVSRISAIPHISASASLNSIMSIRCDLAMVSRYRGVIAIGWLLRSSRITHLSTTSILCS